MPIIQINVAQGRTAEQRAAAMAEITHAVVRTLNVRPEQVRILINEVDPENFSIGGQTFATLLAQQAPTSEQGE